MGNARVLAFKISLDTWSTSEKECSIASTDAELQLTQIGNRIMFTELEDRVLLAEHIPEDDAYEESKVRAVKDLIRCWTSFTCIRATFALV